MAGDWIPIRIDLARDPAVIQVAHELNASHLFDAKVDEDWVVGKLCRLWGWASSELKSGLAKGVTPAWIDRFLGVEGFADALIKSGWLRAKKTGVFFPGWSNWLANSAKTRLANAMRAKTYRDQARAQKRATNVRTENRDRDSDRDSRDRALSLEYSDSGSTPRATPKLPADSGPGFSLNERTGTAGAGPGAGGNGEARLMGMLYQEVSEHDWRKMPDRFRVQTLMRICGVDDADFRSFASKYAPLGTVMSVAAQYAKRRKSIRKPGAWWRTKLRNEGVTEV